MTESSLFSAQWYRVRHIKAELAPDVDISRHVYRGRLTYILHRRTTASYQKLHQASFKLINRLDGEATVEEIWNRAIATDDTEAPTQDEWIGLLADLYNAELLVVNRRVPAENLFSRREKKRSLDRKQRYLNPLFLRFPLYNPNRLLDWLSPVSTWLFSKSSLFVWSLLMGSALLVGVAESERLMHGVARSGFLGSFNVLMMACIYPLLKGVHELAHGLAIKRFGGAVSECGIAMMVFFPIPYVDASASTAYPDKNHRMLVSAAGVFVELGLAAAGLLLWSVTSGALAEIGLTVFLLGGISSLVFNGNPLLKFDAYYVFSDWVEIPNLYRYSRQTVLSFIRSLITGERDELRIRQDKAERQWLLWYGLLSSIYRVVLMMSIAWMLSQKWFVLGVAIALFTCYLFLIKPMTSLVTNLVSDTAFRSVRSIITLVAIPVFLLLTITRIPLSYAATTTGVVWIPEDSVMRIARSCYVVSSDVKPGEFVNKGQMLFNCQDPDDNARVKELVALVDELQVRRAGVLARDPLAVSTLQAELDASFRALDTARQYLDTQHIRAATSGQFDVVGESVLAGQFLERGSVIAYVVPDKQRRIRIAVNELQMSRIEQDLQRIEVRLRDSEGQYTVYQTQIAQRSPIATLQVATSGLTSQGGGEHRADPSGDGRQVTDPLFDVELLWPESAQLNKFVGTHVDVKLVFGNETLYSQLSNWLYGTVSLTTSS